MNKRVLVYSGIAAAVLATLSPAVRADQVFADDVIIQGSNCVGFDCVNNENFGFDTLRLKENNTRIKFEDTSVGTFPSTDWQLTANDSASGGANKFSIEDITSAKVPFTISASAPSNTFFMSSSGYIGVGTSAPVLKLHVKQNNTPGMRLEQDNSGGFTAQTWDLAGNEANFFIRDVTNGSLLPFRIRPGAPTSSIDIAANGNVGVGTASPAASMEIKRSTTGADTTLMLTYPADNAAYGELRFREGSTDQWSMGVAASNDFYYIYNYPNNRVDLKIQSSNGYIGLGGIVTVSHPIHHYNGAYLSTGGAWTNASSRTLKHDIQELSASVAMETLKSLKPVTFRYNAEPEDETVGFIAEDVPDLVATPDHKSLSSMDIVAVLTRVVQQQQAKIDKLEKMLTNKNQD